MKTHKTKYTLGDFVYVLDGNGAVQYHEVNEVIIRKTGTFYIVGSTRYPDGKVYDAIDDILNALRVEFTGRKPTTNAF